MGCLGIKSPTVIALVLLLSAPPIFFFNVFVEKLFCCGFMLLDRMIGDIAVADHPSDLYKAHYPYVIHISLELRTSHSDLDLVTHIIPAGHGVSQIHLVFDNCWILLFVCLFLWGCNFTICSEELHAADVYSTRVFQKCVSPV